MSIQKVFIFLALSGLCAAIVSAQEEKVEQSYRAFGVAMGPGVSGVLDIHISRWTTDDERKALIEEHETSRRKQRL